jgi:hypothetical protein
MAAEGAQDFWGTISVVALGIIGVASLALLVSKNATTTSLIQSTGVAFNNALGTAISPVTGMGNSYSAANAFPIY